MLLLQQITVLSPSQRALRTYCHSDILLACLSETVLAKSGGSDPYPDVMGTLGFGVGLGAGPQYTGHLLGSQVI
jgi:hypothetical protein